MANGRAAYCASFHSSRVPPDLFRQCLVGVIIMCAGMSVVWATERRTIDLRQGNNLKIIFDAGLRPWRSRGLEKYECDIFHEESLNVVLPNGEQIEIDIERAHFTVRAGNALGEANFFGVTEPVPSAVQRVKDICRAGGLSDEGLERIAGDLGVQPDPNKRWFQQGTVGGVNMSVTFYPMWFRDPVEAQVWVTVQWGPFGEPMKFLTAPIEPPPGYEGVSMDPPTLAPFPTRTTGPPS